MRKRNTEGCKNQTYKKKLFSASPTFEVKRSRAITHEYMSSLETIS